MFEGRIRISCRSEFGVYDVLIVPANPGPHLGSRKKSSFLVARPLREGGGGKAKAGRTKKNKFLKLERRGGDKALVATKKITFFADSLCKWLYSHLY